MTRKFCLNTILIMLLFLPKPSYGRDVPAPEGWVNDFAGVIPADYKSKLDALLQELEEKTSTEIAVVTMDSIAPYDEQQYARLLFNDWKPGKKGKDNGVLILLAVKERRWRIETGYGAEGILPDGLCGEIGRNHMSPYFKEGRYGEGLYYGVSAVAKVVVQDADVTLNALSSTLLSAPKQQAGKSDNIDAILSALFVVFVLYMSLKYMFITPWKLGSRTCNRISYGGGGFGGGGGGFGGGFGGGGGAGGGF